MAHKLHCSRDETHIWIHTNLRLADTPKNINTISCSYHNPSGHHLRFKTYTNPFPCQITNPLFTINQNHLPETRKDVISQGIKLRCTKKSRPFLRRVPQKIKWFNLLKMPLWWDHVFEMVAPLFDHGATTFSWMTISFSEQCPKTWCLATLF